MNLYDLSDEDVAFVCGFAFEPQKVKGFLDKKKLVLASNVCFHVSIQKKQLAVIGDSSPGFEGVQWSYQCCDCGMLMEPTGFRPKELK